MAYCVEHDCDFLRLYMTARRALVACFQGRWQDAIDLAGSVLRDRTIAAVSRIVALVALGRTRARRGDPDAAPPLDEALELALATGDVDRIGPARAARAELAWLTSDMDRVRTEARAGLAKAMSIEAPWMIGEFTLWLHCAGDVHEPPVGAARPFVHEIAGDWMATARAWEALGCPYEAARARAVSRHEPALRQALSEFQRLGARPAEAFTRRRLMELGARNIPRGHRASTRAHVGMLTAREIDVLTLMAAGSTNAEIAAQLYLSPKTVENHATSIFHKLKVGTRRDAVRVAARHGLLP